MTRRIIDLDLPDRVTALVTGEPGSETFHLRAARGARVVTVALERQQLALLADRMLTVIDELERRGLVAIDIGVADVADEVPRAARIRDDFTAGTLAIAWDDDGDRLVLEAFSEHGSGGAGESALPLGQEPDLDELADEDPIGPDVLRVRLTPIAAQRFARQAVRASVVGGMCPVCGMKLGSGRHRCRGADDAHGAADSRAS